MVEGLGDWGKVWVLNQRDLGLNPGSNTYDVSLSTLPNLTEAQFLHLLKGMTYALQNGHEDLKR